MALQIMNDMATLTKNQGHSSDVLDFYWYPNGAVAKNVCSSPEIEQGAFCNKKTNEGSKRQKSFQKEYNKKKMLKILKKARNIRLGGEGYFDRFCF